MKKYTILTSLLILVLTMVPVRATGSQALKHILASLKKYGDENIMTSDQYDNYYQPAIESMEALVTSSDENAPAATTINRKAIMRPDTPVTGTITLPPIDWQKEQELWKIEIPIEEKGKHTHKQLIEQQLMNEFQEMIKKQQMEYWNTHGV